MLGDDVEQLGGGGADELPPAGGRRRVDGAHLGGQGDRSTGDPRARVALGVRPRRRSGRCWSGSRTPARSRWPRRSRSRPPCRRTTSAAGRRSISATSARSGPSYRVGILWSRARRRGRSSGSMPSVGIAVAAGRFGPSAPDSGEDVRPRGSGRSDGRSKATSTLARPGTTDACGHCRRARAATRSTHWVPGAPRPGGSTSSARSPNGRIASGSPRPRPLPLASAVASGGWACRWTLQSGDRERAAATPMPVDAPARVHAGPPPASHAPPVPPGSPEPPQPHPGCPHGRTASPPRPRFGARPPGRRCQRRGPGPARPSSGCPRGRRPAGCVAPVAQCSGSRGRRSPRR